MNFFKTKRAKSIFVLFTACVLLVTLNFTSIGSVFFNQQSKSLTIIIDAGHGGFDGGAVSDSGVMEKDLNLDIAKTLQDELKNRRYNVIMTREDDTALAQSKKDDIKNRVKIMQEYKDALFISIHCNKFPQKNCSGLQCFYSSAVNEDVAKSLAESIQIKYKEMINSSCNRSAKSADKSIYLMKNAKTTAILIECGFVSNEEELGKLMSNNYRVKLSQMIADCIDENFKE